MSLMAMRGCAASSTAASRQGTFRPQRAVACNALSRLELHSTETSRRALLQASLITGWMVAAPSAWAAGNLCSEQDSAEAAAACQQDILAKDSTTSTPDYKALSGGGAKKLAPNVPVSTLDAEYDRATRDLATKIETYITTDVYDKARQPLIKSLKVDGSTWVSKYARGGSARSQSAHTMYVAVDAVQGYLASNGLAPFPARKAVVVRETIQKSLAFLDEGR